MVTTKDIAHEIAKKCYYRWKCKPITKVYSRRFGKTIHNYIVVFHVIHPLVRIFKKLNIDIKRLEDKLDKLINPNLPWYEAVEEALEKLPDVVPVEDIKEYTEAALDEYVSYILPTRLHEIEEAYKRGEISEEEYKELKKEIEEAISEYKKERDKLRKSISEFKKYLRKRREKRKEKLRKISKKVPEIEKKLKHTAPISEEKAVLEATPDVESVTPEPPTPHTLISSRDPNFPTYSAIEVIVNNEKYVIELKFTNDVVKKLEREGFKVFYDKFLKTYVLFTGDEPVIVLTPNNIIRYLPLLEKVKAIIPTKDYVELRHKIGLHKAELAETFLKAYTRSLASALAKVKAYEPIMEMWREILREYFSVVTPSIIEEERKKEEKSISELISFISGGWVLRRKRK